MEIANDESLTLSGLKAALAALLRRRIENGELTERQLARLAGISQPHLHNVLKGIRSLSDSMADRILAGLHLNVHDLLPPPRKGPQPVQYHSLRGRYRTGG